MQFTAQLDGGSVTGEDSGGPGTPVVLLHPDWGDSAIWDAAIGLIPRTARVIRYDARGYGRSPAPTEPCTPMADLLAVLDQLGVADAVLVGHSGGGATALSLAVEHPHRVRSLILAAPGVSDYPWPEDDPYFTESAPLFAAGDQEGLVALGLRTWAVADADPVAESQIRSAVAAMLEQGRSARADPTAFHRLDRIRVPVDVLIGERDHPMVVDCAVSVAAAVPGARLTRLPGADHMLPLRDPERLAQAIAGSLG